MKINLNLLLESFFAGAGVLIDLEEINSKAERFCFVSSTRLVGIIAVRGSFFNASSVGSRRDSLQGD